MRVVVANEPRAYREVFAEVFRHARPDIEVIAMDPTVLDRDLNELRPDLVFCSRLTGPVECSSADWALIAFGSGERSEVSVGGRRRSLTGISFQDMVRIIDRASGAEERGGSTRATPDRTRQPLA
jgi:hypothetical protein